MYAIKHHAEEYRLDFFLKVSGLIFFIGIVIYIGVSALEFFGLNPILSIIVGIVLYAIIYIMEGRAIFRILKFISNHQKGYIGSIIGLVLLAAFNISCVYIGVKNTQNKQIEKSENTISTTSSADSLNITNEYNTEIKRYEDLIQDIKDNPAVIASGRVLSSSQLSLIQSYNGYIVELRSAKEMKLNELENHKILEINEKTSKHTTNAKIFFLGALFLELIIIFFMYMIANYFVKSGNQTTTMKGNSIIENYEYGRISLIAAIEALEKLQITNIDYLLKCNVEEVKKAIREDGMNSSNKSVPYQTGLNQSRDEQDFSEMFYTGKDSLLKN